MAVAKHRVTAALLALAAIALPAVAVEIGAQGPAVDPKAIQLLKRMTDYLGGLQSFTVVTDNMLEDVLVSGQKVQHDFTASVVVQRPNKLRAERTGYLLNQLLIYDGKTLTIHNREDGHYATAAAPDNIDSVLHFARDTLDIVPPIGDMVFTKAFDLLTANLTSGAVVGKSLVGGVRCDHLAFRTPFVDWQIWIADGDKPLPHKYVLTTMDDPAQPQYIVLLSLWNVAPKVTAGMFDFSAPQGAKQTEFLRMDIGHTSGR